mmetsp:Transcript_11627/g.27968  ORF Transcript_11627/g.27968 Transcript_11627/m.27968 type:complete len:292 (+) Transcript_11627:196-1071(+)
MKREDVCQCIRSGDERLDRVIGDAIGKSEVEIVKVATRRVERGVLSAVFKVDITLQDDSAPLRWILKICRDDLDIRWMFRKEKIFYTAFGPNVAPEELPFRLAKSISSSEEHIILDFVDNAICHDLLGGCPENKVSFLIHAMACWHAQCWGLDSPVLKEDDLENSPPGIGQRLLPMQKEYLFASKWRDVVDQMIFGIDVSLKEFATQLCCKMENLKLRQIHHIVHNRKVTVIHGDYHIENWLFPSDGSKPVLVDWTAWGYGNPMVDLAFFLCCWFKQRRDFESSLLGSAIY